jgi:hypothetical protein
MCCGVLWCALLRIVCGTACASQQLHAAQHCIGVLLFLVGLLLQVSADVITAALVGADNPQWTCGVVVDGTLSCAGMYGQGGRGFVAGSVLSSVAITLVRSPC